MDQKPLVNRKTYIRVRDERPVPTPVRNQIAAAISSLWVVLKWVANLLYRWSGWTR